MDRFQQIDVTNSSVGAILHHDEEVVSLQEGVGLYDGKEKSLNQGNGTVYLTSHRLIYVDDKQPHRHSCSLDLSLVKQTEYYAGFLKSSPKITLFLAQLKSLGISSSHELLSSSSTLAVNSLSHPTRDWRVNASSADSAPVVAVGENWICSICGFSNPASTVQANSSCQLCGVTRDPAAGSRQLLKSSLSSKNDTPHSIIVVSAVGESLSVNKSPPSAQPGGDGIACPVCTFLNHTSMVKCEICGSSLATEWLDPQDTIVRPASAPMSSGRKSTDAETISLTSRMPPRSSTPGPKPSTSTNSVKLSFRKGGDKSFYHLFKTTLKAKAWSASSRNDIQSLASFSTSASTSTSTINTTNGATRVSFPANDVDGRTASKRRVGIDGVLTAVDSSTRLQGDDMHGALKDLEALMAKAKQMVEFAESLNAKLIRQENAAAVALAAGDSNNVPPTPDKEAATLIRSSLVRLGLPAPAVTEDMAKDQEEYHRELARELAGVLLGGGGGGSSSSPPGLMGKGNVLAKGKSRDSLTTSRPETGRGLVGLDEVWCVWNRARGVALIPPQALRSAAAYLPELTSPSIRIKTFKSGLAVLHTPRYSDDAFTARLVAYLDQLEWEHQIKIAETKTRYLSMVSNQSLLSPQQAAEGEQFGQICLQSSSSPPIQLAPSDPNQWGSGASILEIAQNEDAPILLISEMIHMVETCTGLIVRDEGGPNGTRWFINQFSRLSTLSSV